MPSLFPCRPVIRECSWKKTQIEKKCTFFSNFTKTFFRELAIFRFFANTYFRKLTFWKFLAKSCFCELGQSLKFREFTLRYQADFENTLVFFNAISLFPKFTQEFFQIFIGISQRCFPRMWKNVLELKISFLNIYVCLCDINKYEIWQISWKNLWTILNKYL